MADISNSGDILDVRDIIARLEELESERDQYTIEEDADTFDPEEDKANAAAWAEANPEDGQELATLAGLLDDLKGYGGDEQWRGDWYPVTLIRDSYWQYYAEDYADDIHGEAIRNASWPMNHIDWEKAADDLRTDYSSVEYDGVTYWYR